jgi:hypothetical protein
MHASLMRQLNARVLRVRGRQRHGKTAKEHSAVAVHRKAARRDLVIITTLAI